MKPAPPAPLSWQPPFPPPPPNPAPPAFLAAPLPPPRPNHPPLLGSPPSPPPPDPAPPFLGSPPPPPPRPSPPPPPPPALKVVREWEGVGVWPVATAPRVSALVDPPTAQFLIAHCDAVFVGFVVVECNGGIRQKFLKSNFSHCWSAPPKWGRLYCLLYMPRVTCTRTVCRIPNKAKGEAMASFEGNIYPLLGHNGVPQVPYTLTKRPALPRRT